MSTLKKPLTDDQKSFIYALQNKFGPVVTRKQIVEEAKANAGGGTVWRSILRMKTFRTNRGHYNLESILAANGCVCACKPAEGTSDGTIDGTGIPV